MVDPYFWMQREAFITASQERFLDGIPGWNDAKLDESPGVPAASENGSFQLGSESRGKDSRESKEEAYKGFPQQQTVEIASLDDFAEEKLEESYNSAFESNRSRSPCPSESFSLPILEFLDIPTGPYATQIGMSEIYNDAGLGELAIDAQTDPLATSAVSNKIVCKPPLKLAVSEFESKVLLCKVETQETECRGYGKHRKQHSLMMQDPKSPSLHLLDEEEGDPLFLSSADTFLKHVGSHIEQRSDAIKHDMESSLRSLAAPPFRRIEENEQSLSPVSFALRRELEDTCGISFEAKSFSNACQDFQYEEVQNEQISFHENEQMAGIQCLSSADLASTTDINLSKWPQSNMEHAQIFHQNEGKHSSFNKEVTSEHIPVTNQAAYKKDTFDNTSSFGYPVSREAITEELRANLLEKDFSIYPESVMDVVMHHSGPLPPLSSNTDFRIIAMKSGLSLPYPFGCSHRCIRK